MEYWHNSKKVVIFANHSRIFGNHERQHTINTKKHDEKDSIYGGTCSHRDVDHDGMHIQGREHRRTEQLPYQTRHQPEPLAVTIRRTW
jgi:hypothetical protein